MAQKSIQGSKALAQQIKFRRNELGLTIEEAACRAGVGTKTWCRYEAGESIRTDKCKGICKALGWHSLPTQEPEDDDRLSIDEFRKYDAWSKHLEDVFGPEAALSFAAGSDILLDHIEEDLQVLSSMPAGTHIGQLDISWMAYTLPKQFLMQYTYEFLYQMKCTLLQMRDYATAGLPMTAHSVLEELILYLCSREASALIELCGGIYELENAEAEDCYEWIFDLFGDMDIITFLYCNICLDAGHAYHFSNWTKKQFYMN